MSHDMRFPTIWYVRPAKAHTSLRICAVWSEPLLVAWIYFNCQATDCTSIRVSKLKSRLHSLIWVYTCKNATLLEIMTVLQLEFLNLKVGFTVSSESTLVKMPHCWKSHIAAHVHLLVAYPITFTVSWTGLFLLSSPIQCLVGFKYCDIFTDKKIHFYVSLFFLCTLSLHKQSS